ncbi:MAG TPA: tyrosine recombinase XerC [Gammaproteobacteria bacterium]|nr:tyrosine recombinase XerC [Gammaproteobacteria bacterium]
MTLADWQERYLSHLHHERRLSSHTLAGYRRDLHRLLRYCKTWGLTSWADLDQHRARDYAAALHREGLGGRSIQRHLSALRGFCEYLIREGVLRHNPARGVHAPRTPRKLPAALDVDQVQRLLEIGDDSPLAVRDRAILELCYSSGLRLSELIGLNLDHLNLEDGTVTVTGKGGKTRVVPVGRHAREALRRWLATRPAFAVDPGEAALFLSRRGRRLAPRTLQQRLRHWARRQGLAGTVHPHQLRHSFASHVLESSGDLRAVQELLGHADISTTQIYTHLDFQHLAQVYDSSHPRARRRRA